LRDRGAGAPYQPPQGTHGVRPRGYAAPGPIRVERQPADARKMLPLAARKRSPRGAGSARLALLSAAIAWPRSHPSAHHKPRPRGSAIIPVSQHSPREEHTGIRPPIGIAEPPAVGEPIALLVDTGQHLHVVGMEGEAAVFGRGIHGGPRRSRMPPLPRRSRSRPGPRRRCSHPARRPATPRR